MITPSFGLTATERVLPKLALDFTTAILDSRITFTRSGNTATVINSSGLVAGVNADIPRFDYDPITKVCRGLLIEESRSNILLQSENFLTTWTISSGIVRTSNTTVAPDGNTTADTIASNGTNTFANIQQTFTASGTVAVSFFVKQDSGDTVFVRLLNGTDIGGAGQTQAVYRFNFSTASWTRVTGGTATTASVQAFDNGWYRIALVFTTTTLGAVMLYPAYNSAATNSFYAWGAQLEAGAFPTSYIPTTTTALTRNADVATMTGTNFSDWFNASEGTFECTFINAGQDATHGAIPFAAHNGTTNSFSIYRSSASTTIRAYSTSNNVVIGTMAYGSVMNSALSYNTSSGTGAINAGYTANLTTTSFGTPNQLSFGCGAASSNQFSGWLRDFNFWNQKVTTREVLSFSK